MADSVVTVGLGLRVASEEGAEEDRFAMPAIGGRRDELNRKTEQNNEDEQKNEDVERVEDVKG